MGLGPIGHGWVTKQKTADGLRWIAKWQEYKADPSKPGGRYKAHGGQHDLGPVVKHGEGLKSPTAAKELWRTICDSIMHSSPSTTPVLTTVPAKTLTFKQYCETIWLPKHRVDWNEDTRHHNETYYFETKLYPEFGDRLLRDVTDKEIKSFYKKLASGYSKTVVQHCRIHTSSIFRLAHGTGVITTNPAVDIKLPDCRPVKRVATELDEALRTIERLPTRRDKLIANLLYFGGARRGELFAIRWNDFAGLKMRIDSKVNRHNKEGKVKTQAGNRELWLPEEIATELAAWKEWNERADIDDFIFASRKGTPINAANWLKRVLKPAGTAAGLGKMTFATFRRGVITELHDDGASDKSIQLQAGHSNPDVTRGVYMQGKESSRKKAVQQLFTKGQKTVLSPVGTNNKK